VRSASPSCEPFRVRPVELVMLEQRWCALWNAVELGELPLQEWESLAEALSVVDPSGRRWRVATGSHPSRLRFVIAGADGDTPAEDTQWPWPQRRSGSGGPAAQAEESSLSAQALAQAPLAWPSVNDVPQLAPRRAEYPAYAPPARVAVLPDPARRRSRSVPAVLRPDSWQLGVLDLPRVVRGGLALVVAVVCVAVGFSYRAGADLDAGGGPAETLNVGTTTSESTTTETSIESTTVPSLQTAPPPGVVRDRIMLLPSMTGALVAAAPTWSEVSCFRADRTTRVRCTTPHAFATGVLPHPLAVPPDARALCASTVQPAPSQNSAKVTEAQWVDIDGGLLICTVGRFDAAGSPVESAGPLITGPASRFNGPPG
jgi:hypothetical protein